MRHVEFSAHQKRRVATEASDLEISRNISRYLALLIQRIDRVIRARQVDPQVNQMSHTFGNRDSKKFGRLAGVFQFEMENASIGYYYSLYQQ
jgi:hypothetical protein